ncbi:MAG: hypothetical protein ABJA79_05065 [Parafilimonas sp.]
MKKITSSLCALIIAIISFAAIPITTTKNLRADEIMVPLFGTEQKISLAEYVKLNPKEYKTLTGKN